MPIVRRWVKGPMWLHFLVGVSFSSSFFLLLFPYIARYKGYTVQGGLEEVCNEFSIKLIDAGIHWNYKIQMH